jgi:hypothetical protein
MNSELYIKFIVFIFPEFVPKLFIPKEVHIITVPAVLEDIFYFSN